MTNSEFKAWFDGFTEGMCGETPTSKQWDRIKARVKEIDGAPVTERHYVDRYWRPSIYPYYAHYPYNGPYYGIYAANTCASQQATVSNNLAMCQGLNAMGAGTSAQSFNSQNAMYALGQLDAQAV